MFGLINNVILTIISLGKGKYGQTRFFKTSKETTHT